MVFQNLPLLLLLFNSLVQKSHGLPSQYPPNSDPVRPHSIVNVTLTGEGPASTPSPPPTPPQGRRDWPPDYSFNVGHHGCSLKILGYGSRTRSATYLNAFWQLFDQAYEYIDDPRHVLDRQGVLSQFYSRFQWPSPVHGYRVDPPPLMFLSIQVTEPRALFREDLRSVLGRLQREVQWSGKPAVELLADVMVGGKVKAIIVVEFGKGREGYGSVANGATATA